jgi:BirA family biotin operon repressor/biotin-[acetyl-CoA-carboxylase] ligase
MQADGQHGSGNIAGSLGERPDSAAAMTRWLQPSDAWTSVQAFDALDSTQAEMRRAWTQEISGLNQQNSSGWRLIRADQQSAGRGRQGARWLDRPGNSLLMTLGGPVALDAAHWPKLALVAGLAALRTVQGLAGLQGAEIRLKWPNDLVVRTPHGWRKLAGLLTERLERPGGEAVWLCGLGLNVLAVPDELAESAACLSDLTAQPLPGVDELAGRLATALAREAQQLADRRGTLPLADLENSLAFRGERLRLDEGPLHGERWVELRGLTPSGALWAIEVAEDGAALAQAVARPWLPLALLEAQPSGWRAGPRLNNCEAA